MSRYLKAQQKLIDSAFARVRPATSTRAGLPQAGAKPAARKAPSRRAGAR